MQVQDEMTAASELAAELHLERVAAVVVHEQPEQAMRRVHGVLAVRDAHDLIACTASLLPALPAIAFAALSAATETA